MQLCVNIKKIAAEVLKKLSFQKILAHFFKDLYAATGKFDSPHLRVNVI